MKSIYQLIPDIQELLKTRGWFDAQAESFSSEIIERLGGQFKARTVRPSLRLSQLGPRCPKALWHSINTPELAEELPPWAEFKFSFGHIIEGMAISLTRACGHTVVGEQDELDVDGVIGHRDCIIDGCLVDVKSAASRSFEKFKDGSIAEADTFGYLDQLDGYMLGSLTDPLLTVKDRAFLLAIDKQLGHMCLYEHKFTERRAENLRKRIAKYREIVALQSPPPCECGTRQHGESGNIQLDVQASYSPYKFCCFPALRTFVYSKGPNKKEIVYLSKVVREPKVLEIDRYGRPVGQLLH